MPDDFYKTLEVAREASQADIQKAYRRLARKYHPDMNPDDKTAKKKFQEVQAAFDVLNDSKKREMYDRYGSAFESAAGAQPGATWHTAGGPEAEDFDFSQFFGERFGAGDAGSAGGFADIFGQFGRGRAGTQSRRTRTPPRERGADVEHTIEIPFNTAILGGQSQIGVRRASGKTDTINVKIPAGIEDGKRIRLRGQGEPGVNDGPPGDILLTVRVAQHPSFRRRGDDLEVRVPVTMAEAAEGAKVDVPAPKGTVAVRVPPRSSSGTRLRIKGHGVARAGKTAGDLYAELLIVLPKGLSDEEVQQIRDIDQRHPSNPRADLRW
ncbi:MAG: J domain-containing protein [Planctomycetia bacterium]|nr:J domain-containing protein [Planctomycetia bacterium]